MVLQFWEYPRPISSFEQPVSSPNVEPTDTPLVSVCFNVLWLPYILGALNQLVLQSTWADEDYALAMRRGASLVQLFSTAIDQACGAGSDIEPPYWDTASDADDELPPGEQSWYGIFDGEFHETVENFVISGFIALAGAPGAAIAFLTIAPKFRLAWKTGNLGGIIRIFIDANDYGTVDTYSADEGILTKDFFADTDSDTHEIIQVLEDSGLRANSLDLPVDVNAPMMVIRKLLDPREVANPTTRYNPDCDCVELTPDGGNTWIPEPALDPRHNPSFKKPPLDNPDARCIGATNLRNYTEQIIQGVTDNAAFFSAATHVLGVITFFMPGIDLIIDVILEVIGGLVDLGREALVTDFTEAAYDDLKCIFYCNEQADGSFTAGNIAAIQSQIHTQMGGIIPEAMDFIFTILGEVGASNAASADTPEANCSACDCGSWCWVIDFTIDDGGYSSEGDLGAHYTSGVGWESNTSGGWRGTYIQSPVFAAVEFTRIEIVYTALDNVMNHTIDGYLSGERQFLYSFAGLISIDHHVAWDGVATIDYIKLSVQNSDTFPAGYSKISKVIYYGNGINPFGVDNCD